MEPLLQVSGLHINFPGSNTPAVDKLSFELYRSETLGIVGESGSGKSATALALLRLLPRGTQVLGKVLFYDPEKNNEPIDLISLPEKALYRYRGKKISIIFQDPMASLNPSMRCGHQVDEMLRLHTSLTPEQRKKQVLSLFTEMQLPDPLRMYNRYPHQLSGGQRQRVMMAIALASRPQILIADEPTTALDVTTQHEILTLLKKIQQQYNLSIIFISHDLRLVERIADRVLVLQQGKLIERGNIREIFQNPREAYTRHLLSCRLSPVAKNNIQPANALQPDYSKPPLLEMKNIEVSFTTSRFNIGKSAEKKILQHINLQLWEGETLGIVGESGSGKTTLGRSLMQLIRYRGDISLNGQPVEHLMTSDRKKFYRQVQLIFQDPYSSLNPRMRIGEIIRETLAVHGILPTKLQQIERVRQLLESVRIDPQWYNRYPHQLSGGQRQRVAIARALALQPRILICDECVSALDTTIAAQILNLLNDLKNQFRLSYLFISHDLNLVRHMANRVIVLKDGQIVESNFTSSLFENPRHTYTQQLIQASL